MSLSHDRTPIKVIVFDFGGVLYTYNYIRSLHYFSGTLGISFERAEAAWNARIDEFERGAITETGYWDAFRKAAGVEKDDVFLHEMFVSMFTPMPESLEIKRRLKPQYRLGMLSNNCEWERDMNGRLHLRDGFDLVLMSYELGARKPEPKIFELLIDRAGARPEEIVFIDDTAAYGPAVEAAGIRFIHFRSPRQLSEELHLLSVWF
ncbi:MAG: HAD family phosphatase [candidate division Zixibacteria bacterium]|nr:HAD family phosphatase [candidate division Zixibacteria bacterium]